jgi:RNA polymerase-associated protein LEO1
MSLQIGSELFDIGSHLETSAASSVSANASAAASSIGADLSQSQLSQSIDKKPAANGLKQKPKRLPSDTAEPDPESTALTYLTTPYKEAGVLSIEVPVAGTLTFKPSDMNSETHRKLAQAVKHHRVAKVTADIGPDKDPELMMEEQDKRLKDIERKKARERKKQEEKFEDDAFVGLKRRGGKSLRAGSYSGDEAGGRSGPSTRGGVRRDHSDEYEQDDFVVSSPAPKNAGDGDGSVEDDDGAGGSDMDVDDEPDEMEKMEAQIVSCLARFSAQTVH